MNPIDDATSQAMNMGRIAADQSKALHGGAAVIGNADPQQHPREAASVLVLLAYHDQGAEGVRAVVEGYRDGYSGRAAELGTESLDVGKIRTGIHWALPKRTTDDEVYAIRSALL